MKYFLCSEGLIESMKPEHKSKYLVRFGEKVAVAKIDFEKAEEFFNDFTEDQQRDYDFWCQEIVRGTMDMSDYDMKTNIFKWIYECHDLSKLTNHCMAIGNVSYNEGITPIDLFNKLYALTD